MMIDVQAIENAGTRFQTGRRDTKKCRRMVTSECLGYLHAAVVEREDRACDRSRSTWPRVKITPYCKFIELPACRIAFMIVLTMYSTIQMLQYILLVATNYRTTAIHFHQVSTEVVATVSTAEQLSYHL
jgi:hypothetical protein